MTSLECLEETSAGENSVNGRPVDLSEVLSPVELPCGRVLPNRLVKAAMYEHLAPFLGGPPSDSLNALYSVWARGGWGMVITGNVQVSQKHLSLGADMVVPDLLSEKNLESFKKLASVIKGRDVEGRGIYGDRYEMRPFAVMQLNHTGRQSPNGLGGRWPFIEPPLSASATRVGTSADSRRTDNLLARLLNGVIFQRARAMTDTDIDSTLKGFVRGAHLAVLSGFDGIQIHGAHGYLVTQFISRKTNIRTDTFAPPLALLNDIVRAIRSAVPRNFIVGLKLNAADYSSGGFTEAEGADHLAEIAHWEWDGAGIDFIEISGGDYESPEFMQKSSPRQTFFESFSRVAVSAVDRERQTKKPPLIMLTGGLRTRLQVSRVLKRKHAHLLGFARSAVLRPDLPLMFREYHESTRLANGDDKRAFSSKEESWGWETQPSPEPRSPNWWPRLIGAGVGMAWYVVGMHRLALGRKLPFDENWVLVVAEMYFGGFLRRRYSILFTTVVAVVVLFFIRG